MKRLTIEKALDLHRSAVRFIDSDGRHEYRFGFDELTGVTSILKSVIYYDKYKRPEWCSEERWEEILTQAQERGTQIHNAIQAEEMGFDPQIPDGYERICREAVDAYIRALMGNYSQLNTLYCEYLVSNEQDIASKIDMVMYDEQTGEVVLADIKTTAELDTEYLSWQLSVYAYLFEHQVLLPVSRLLGIWVRGNKCEFVDIKRKSDSEVEELFADWRAGVQRIKTEVMTEEIPVPALVTDGARMYAELDAEIKRLQALQDAFKGLAKDWLSKTGEKSREVAGLRITYTAPTTAKKLDAKALQKDHPELYAQYLRDSKVSDKLTITIKDK